MVSLPLFLITAIVMISLLTAHLVARRQLREQHARLAISEMESEKAREDMVILRDQLTREQNRSELFLNRTEELVFVCSITDDGLPGPFLEANEEAVSRLGYSRERLLRMTPLDIEYVEYPTAMSAYARLHDVENAVNELSSLIDDESIEKEHVIMARRQVKRILSAGFSVYERTYLARNGTHIPVKVLATRFEVGDKTQLLLCAKDLTEQHDARQALRESERRSRDYFAHSAVGVANYDGEHKLINVNRICLRLFGAPDQEAFGQLNLFDHPYMPDDVREALSHGETIQYEAIFDFDDIRTRQLFVTTKSGKAHLVIVMTNLGLDKNYGPKGYLIQVMDITERRKTEAELEHSEIQLRQAQKLQAIGTLAGGIAHDFNNILTPVLGYTEMALDLAKHSDRRLRDYLYEVIKASMRAKDLAGQILTFSRRSDAEGKPVRLTPIIKEVLNLQRAALNKNITIHKVFNATTDIVIADPSQIHQVIMNLCTNAAHAMQTRGGELEVTLSDFLLKASQATEFPNLEAGRYVILSVRDTGKGIDAATGERLFEPFFTTKPRGEGTGMGLAVVHGIVTSLGGAITFDSTLGVGTVFHIILPTVDIEAATVASPDVAIPTGHECILFVDDEVDIIKMHALMLASLGYRPVTTHKSTEALKLFEMDPDRYDLVITDQVMPEMSGLDLARHIHAIRPTQPIMICTGFSEGFPTELAASFGVREIVLKPAEKKEMAIAIRRALDSSAPVSTP
ncbi:MAG: ATP-binding protein [Verrucomicrobia bacterium]|nr:ATP-binding protein [Verrucomicrobiota bacterium]